MGVTYRDLVTGSLKLASVPELYVRIREALESPTASAAKIGDIIGQDPALTARLLKIANSPLYGFSNKIDTISRAIMVIGTRGLSDLVLAASALDVFTKIPSHLINMAGFWRHSVYTAVVARILAGKCNILHAERLFVSGLLHDIGELIILYKLPEMGREALLRSHTLGQGLAQAEQDVMGFDHAAVGGELLQIWNLPDSIVEAVRCHHAPGAADQYGLESAILHLATGLAAMGEDNDPAEQHGGTLLLPEAWASTGLSDELTESILSEARPQFISALSLFLPKTASAA